MIKDEHKDELIEQYLLGKLSGDNLNEFEKKLTTNDAFKSEIELQRAILRNIKAVGRKKWALKLESIQDEVNFHNHNKEQEGLVQSRMAPLKSLRKRNYFLAVAATIILIIFSTVYIITQNVRTSPEKIFSAYYQPYEALEQTTRSAPPGVSSEKKEAFKAYNEGDYLKSIKLFKNVIAKDEDEAVLFYLANAYLSANNTFEAEITFKKYLDKYKEFAIESRWYLSLIYLKRGKTNDAKKMLQELAQGANNYSNEASDILRKL